MTSRSCSMRPSGFNAIAGKKKRLAPPELLEQSQSLCFAVDSRSLLRIIQWNCCSTLRRCGTIRVGRGEGAHRLKLRD